MICLPSIPRLRLLEHPSCAGKHHGNCSDGQLQRVDNQEEYLLGRVLGEVERGLGLATIFSQWTTKTRGFGLQKQYRSSKGTLRICNLYLQTAPPHTPAYTLDPAPPNPSPYGPKP